MAAAVASGCSGTFIRQKDFDAYARRHGLDRLSVGAAIGELQRDGYTCSNQLGSMNPLEVKCEKDFGTSGLQTIRLSPSPSDPSRCVATWELIRMI
jgi:hypothetical protein